MPNPEPVPQTVVCSTCGLLWDQHKKTKGRVTKDECIRLLNAELARRPQWNYSIGGAINTLTASGTTLTSVPKSA